MKEYEERMSAPGSGSGGSNRSPSHQQPTNGASAFTRAVTRSTQAGGDDVSDDSSSAMDVGSRESLSDEVGVSFVSAYILTSF